MQSTIAYDAHGRQTDNGSGRTIAYNAFDLPRSVSQNGGTWTLQYDAFANRAVKTGADGTTIYIGGIFEKRIPPVGNMSGVMDVFNVSGVAQVETNESTGFILRGTDRSQLQSSRSRRVVLRNDRLSPR